MWNTPSKERLDRMPKLYGTENVPLKDKLIHLHFFIGGSDWYACEFDGDDLFFGFVVLNNDLEMAEWGYFSFAELKSIKVNRWLEIDCELEDIWKIRKAVAIDNIRKAQFWREPEADNDPNPPSGILKDVSHNERNNDHDKQAGVHRQQGAHMPVL